MHFVYIIWIFSGLYTHPIKRNSHAPQLFGMNASNELFKDPFSCEDAVEFQCLKLQRNERIVN